MLPLPAVRPEEARRLIRPALHWLDRWTLWAYNPDASRHLARRQCR
jgi:hypothetical protein